MLKQQSIYVKVMAQSNYGQGNGSLTSLPKEIVIIIKPTIVPTFTFLISSFQLLIETVFVSDYLFVQWTSSIPFFLWLPHGNLLLNFRRFRFENWYFLFIVGIPRSGIPPSTRGTRSAYRSLCPHFNSFKFDLGSSSCLCRILKISLISLGR